ncbi:hypothetical protein R3X27_03750 [Tropicimonas sp. TH_r6]|uniref:hypothetical protein n=1 Tax=Tropicimonas sp. TH_r6 TaxID=3082085 RepID=UPI002952C592|nr:hypothetical protein [Tropicimonas sp. TH_r6]MDV7141791.1 hypothetical protein [Tropicimonas sp. TH_r6]
MKQETTMKPLALAALVLAIAAPASALSNMEKTVQNDLRKRGVSEDCLAKLTTNDAARITGWKNDSDMSAGTKNRRIKDEVNKICRR